MEQIQVQVQAQAQAQVQVEKLHIDGKKLDIDGTLKKINKEKNLSPRELYIKNINTTIYFDSVLNPNLQSRLAILSISHCFISPDDAHLIANFIVGSSLLKLELLNCGIGEDSMISIIGAINESFLRTINFKQLFFTRAATKIITSMIERSTLIKLSFISCKFRYEFNSVLSAIKKSLIRTLILHKVNFNDENVIAIADCIANSKLNKLSLHHVSYNGTDACTIFTALKGSTIKTLAVTNVPYFNNFDAINDLIAHSGITKIKFDAGTFDVDERIAIINTMLRHQSSERIQFDYAKLTVQSQLQLVTKMCDLLTLTHQTDQYLIRKLDILDCPLNTKTSNKIIDSIKRSSITSLKLYAFQSTAKTISFICNVLENHPLEKLEIKFCIFQSSIMEQILPSIQKSSIVKFNTNIFPHANKKVCEEINAILQIRQQDARRCRRIKSARS